MAALRLQVQIVIGRVMSFSAFPWLGVQEVPMIGQRGPYRENSILLPPRFVSRWVPYNSAQPHRDTNRGGDSN